MNPYNMVVLDEMNEKFLFKNKTLKKGDSFIGNHNLVYIGQNIEMSLKH